MSNEEHSSNPDQNTASVASILAVTGHQEASTKPMNSSSYYTIGSTSLLSDDTEHESSNLSHAELNNSASETIHSGPNRITRNLFM